MLWSFATSSEEEVAEPSTILLPGSKFFGRLLRRVLSLKPLAQSMSQPRCSPATTSLTGWEELAMLRQFANATSTVPLLVSLRNACEDARLVNLRFHARVTALQRVYGPMAFTNGISELACHTSVRMTSVYTHQTPANLCQAVNTLGQTKALDIWCPRRDSNPEPTDYETV